MTRVLVVEDTVDIAEGVRDHLLRCGFDVRIAGTAADAGAVLARWRPDVLVLDLLLPDGSGYDVLRDLRETGSEMPVLILSATSDEMSKVRGFRDGADDYVTKPFGLREFTARVERLARRAARLLPRPPELVFGAIVVHPTLRRVLRDGAEVALRPKEVDLLLMLIERPNEIVTRQALLAQVWAYEPGVESRTVDWHVAELRRKLGDTATTPHLIETVRKAGYRWIASPVALAPATLT